MNDWRTRSYLQIASLELLLGGPAAASDREVRRRRDVWLAIERFCWPQYKEQQFAQLEQCTRTEAELVGYALQSPPMRDLVAPAKPPGGPPPELPPPVPGFPDWRSRSLFQIGELAKLLGGGDDGEARRRASLWLAIERFAWPQLKEQQFAQVETLCRVENDLLRYLFQMPQAKELILASGAPTAGSETVTAGVGPRADGRPGGAVANVPGAGGVFGDATEMHLKDALSRPGGKDGKPGKKGKKAAADAGSLALASGEASSGLGEETMVEVAPDVDPLGDIAPVEKYSGPPAQWCYAEGTKAWGEFAENEFKDKRKARAAAQKLRELFVFLDKNPESEKQMKALEDVVGLSCLEVMNGDLEKRLK
jgi:hypothetical protein